MENGHLDPRLLALLAVDGPSGFERNAVETWRDHLLRYSNITVPPTDKYGTGTAIKGTGPTKVMLTAHADEIGFMVRYIDEKGFLFVAPIGGWNAQVALGQAVRVYHKDGSGMWTPGVVGHKAVHLMTEDDKVAVKIKDLWLDIGARSKEEAQEWAAVGSYALLKAEPRVLRGKHPLLTCSALDNRLGCFVIEEVLLRARVPETVSLLGVVSTREEIAFRHPGTIATAVHRLAPDYILAVDLTTATDHPGLTLAETGEILLGAGPALTYGSVCNSALTARLEAVAGTNGIKTQRDVAPCDSGTDLDSAVFTFNGAPGALVSIPCRYLHSPVEMISLDDVENTIGLLVAFVEQL